VTAVCFILLSSPLLLFSVLRSCLDEQGAKREITRHNLCQNVQALVSLLQEESLFASRLWRFAVFIALWHLICLLFLGTCFVTIVVAVYVLALRLFRFLLLPVFRLFLHFVPCLLVRSFKIPILIMQCSRYGTAERAAPPSFPCADLAEPFAV
jgi:hypothetical protein